MYWEVWGEPYIGQINKYYDSNMMMLNWRNDVSSDIFHYVYNFLYVIWVLYHPLSSFPDDSRPLSRPIKHLNIKSCFSYFQEKSSIFPRCINFKLYTSEISHVQVPFLINFWPCPWYLDYLLDRLLSWKVFH